MFSESFLILLRKCAWYHVMLFGQWKLVEQFMYFLYCTFQKTCVYNHNAMTCMSLEKSIVVKSGLIDSTALFALSVY